MQFTRLKHVLTSAALVAFAFGTCDRAFANEHGGGAPAEAGEGGGEAAAPPKPPRDHREYVEKTVKLAGLASKLDESEKHFAELVHEKEHAHSADAKQPLLKEMAEVAKQRNLDVTEYNKVKSDLSLRYPNQGEHLNRHFRNHDAKSVEELERGVAAGPSLDELLTETKRMITKKYADPSATPAAGDRHPAAAAPAVVVKPARLRLER